MSRDRESAIKALFASPLAGAVLIALLALFAWHNSFGVPFVFDDKINVLENPSIKSLQPLSSVLSAPPGTGTAGRPLLNLSLAVNYAISGLSPASYHALNLLIHVMSGIVLLGLLRRTFGSPRLSPLFGSRAPVLALAAALAWTLHPLTTESVTYVSQRAESMMGMFFLICLYCAARGFEKRPVNLWHAGAAAALVLGAASKEVIVVAPLLILAWDAVFGQKKVMDALRRSWFLYLGLLAGMAWLFFLVWLGGTAGANPLDHGVGRFNYLITQGGVILHYLRLSFFPVGQAFDYWDWDRSLTLAAYIKATLVGALAVLSIWGLARRHPAGFAGAWFFLVLAPTSSLMPLKCPAYEHRMYLPLAAVAALSVGGLYWAARSTGGRFPENIRKRGGLFGAVLAVFVILVLCGLTIHRNHDYRTEFALWADTLEKRPGNLKAHLNMAQALESLGDLKEAVAHYTKGLAIGDYREVAGAHYNIGNIMAKTGRKDEAEGHYRKALLARPAFPEALVNLAVLLSEKGRTDEAERLYEGAIIIDYNRVEAHFNYANLLVGRGLWSEAAQHYRAVMTLAPHITAASANLAVCEEHEKNR